MGISKQPLWYTAFFLSVWLFAAGCGEQKKADDFFEQGKQKFWGHDWNGAINDLNQAIKLNSQNPDAYLYRGEAERKLNKLDETILDYNRAAELDPKNARIYCVRGFVKGEKLDFDGAISDFNQAISLNPKYSNAYYGRGIAKDGKGDLSGASADLTQAIVM